MRYLNWVHKDVDPGGERHIGRARVLLGVVAQRMKLGGLFQLQMQEVTGDGFVIRAGFAGNFPWVSIRGERREVEELAISLGFIFKFSSLHP